MSNKYFGLDTLKNLYRFYRAIKAAIEISWKCRNYSLFKRAVDSYRKWAFSPREAFRLGLLNGCNLSNKHANCVSKFKMRNIQSSINPVEWEHLTEDKGIFYKHCMALGIPTPKLYAIFFKGTSGWAYDGSLLTGSEGWKEFVEHKVPSEFVIKPARGVYGNGLDVFSNNGSGFLDASGNLYKAKDIYDRMLSDSRYDCYIIQERLGNHPDIIRLTDTHALQTVRAITSVQLSGDCLMLLAHLKLIIGDSIVDNTEHGVRGNMQVLISLADGVIRTPAVMMTVDGSGPKTVSVHPKSGLRFEGFQLPMWLDLCDLVKDSAKKFLPIRTIGWDVALTPKGPVIVEANMFWDPPNAHYKMDEVLDKLFQSAECSVFELDYSL